MNKVTLVGRITRDPELRTSMNNVPFVAFSIAVNRIGLNASGERETDFIRCVAFSKQAENLAHFVKKGALIGVDGKIQTRQRQMPDGRQQTDTEVICDYVHFLSSPQTSRSDYNSYSQYDANVNNRQPQRQQPTNNYQNNYQNSYQNSYNQTPNQGANPFNQQSNYDVNDDVFGDIEEAENQYDINDDKFPF